MGGESPLLTRLDGLIREARLIRAEAKTIPGENRRNWATRQDYRTADREVLDYSSFTEWQTRCASLLAVVIPSKHIFDDLPLAIKRLQCTPGHLDAAIARLKGLRDDPSISNAIIAGTKAETAAIRRGGEGREPVGDRELAVFVGMAFGDDSSPDSKNKCDTVFSAICGACGELRAKADRVDQHPGSAPIVETVYRMIRDADALVFDLTHERPNVYYELGFAHGVEHSDSAVLLVAQIGATLHFDLAHRSVRFYRNTEELRSIVKQWLANVLDELRTPAT